MKEAARSQLSGQLLSGAAGPVQKPSYWAPYRLSFFKMLLATLIPLAEAC